MVKWQHVDANITITVPERKAGRVYWYVMLTVLGGARNEDTY